MNRSKLYVFFILMAVALFISSCGQSSQPAPNPEPVASGESCFSCHTDEGKLLADLAANPLAEKPKADSEGEG